MLDTSSIKVEVIKTSSFLRLEKLLKHRRHLEKRPITSHQKQLSLQSQKHNDWNLNPGFKL